MCTQKHLRTRRPRRSLHYVAAARTLRRESFVMPGRTMMHNKIRDVLVKVSPRYNATTAFDDTIDDVVVVIRMRVQCICNTRIRMYRCAVCTPKDTLLCCRTQRRSSSRSAGPRRGALQPLPRIPWNPFSTKTRVLATATSGHRMTVYTYYNRSHAVTMLQQHNQQLLYYVYIFYTMYTRSVVFSCVYIYIYTRVAYSDTIFSYFSSLVV